MNTRIATVAAVSLLLSSSLTLAEGTTETVRFKSGASSATITGSLVGYDVNKYKLDAEAGQAVSVLFEGSKNACYFNWVEPGANQATHFGEVAGNEFAGTLGKTGTHVIEVYLMRNDARKGAECKYSFTVEISGAAKGQSSNQGMPSKDAQACLAAVSRETNNGDVVLQSEETSEANTLVMVGVGPQRAPWKCLAKDGAVAEVMSMTDEGSQ